MGQIRIQIVEDDKALSDGIRWTLKEEKVTFIQSLCICQAKKDYLQEHPDIVILDIHLPDGSGYDYLQWVKEQSSALVLILTANDLETDEVMGLTLGADDYMTKPFSLAVLRARIHLLMHRIENEKKREEEKNGFCYKEDNFVFHFDHLEFYKDDKKLFFSVNEQKLLRLFVRYPGRILTRDFLIECLWGNKGEYVDENALSVTVNRLRSKLEDKKSGVCYIQTVYGQGYMWKKKIMEK